MRLLLFLFVASAQAKTAVISFGFGDRYDFIKTHVHENRNSYCEIHGYDCLLSQQDVMEKCSESLDFLHLIDPIAWFKIIAIRGCLFHYESVLWLDMDSIIVNKTMSVPDLQAECGGKAAITAGNRCGARTNTGLMVFKHSKEAYDILSFILKESVDPVTRADSWWENRAVEDAVVNETQDICVLRDTVEYFPSRPDCSPRTSNAFLAHTAGGHAERSYLNQLLELRP